MIPEKYCAFDCETTGLNACYGARITCICARTHDGNMYIDVGEDEKRIITGFLEFLQHHQDLTLISANGKDFDVPFIVVRAAILGIPQELVAPMLMMEHFDLQAITKRKVSLSDLSTLFLGTSKEMNGENAIALFYAKNFTDLQKYCIYDIDLVEQVFKVYRRLQAERKEVRYVGKQQNI